MGGDHSRDAGAAGQFDERGSKGEVGGERQKGGHLESRLIGSGGARPGGHCVVAIVRAPWISGETWLLLPYRREGRDFPSQGRGDKEYDRLVSE